MNAGTIAVLLPWLVSAGTTSGVRVPEPIPLVDGSLHSQVRIDGEPDAWWSMLLRWVDGDRCPTSDAFVEPASLRAVGSAIARLHLHAARFPPPSMAGCRRKDAAWLTGPSSAMGNGAAQAMLRPEDFAVFRAAARRVASVLRSDGEASTHFGPIHADLEPGNWVFERGEARPIDFDEFGLGYYLFDLMGALWSHAGREKYPAFRSTLLDAYEAVRPLPPECRNNSDVYLAANFLAWLNHGLAQPDAEVRARLLAHVPASARTLKRLLSN
jgi:Ser/Thr protein kinase RdoA (MazF antagonist)